MMIIKNNLWPPIKGVLLLGILLSGLLGLSCDSQPPQALDTIRLGVSNQPTNILVFVALEKGFFNQHGLKVIPTFFPSGKRALRDGLFKNQVDATTASSAAFAFASLTRNDFAAIAGLFEASNVNRIIARKDKGIVKPSDLMGKNIGTQKSSAVHFFLHLFLLEHEMDVRDIHLSYFKAEQLPEALANGTISAFSMREPFIGMAKQKLGEEAIIFEAPGIYRQSELLILSRSILKARPNIAPALLRSLLAAEHFVRNYPSQAISIVAKAIDVTPQAVRLSLKNSISRVTLEQSLLLTLEDQARWAKAHQLVNVKALPNYLEFIDTKPLSQVNPNAMNLVY